MKNKDCSLDQYSSICTAIREDFSLKDMLALKDLLIAFIEIRIEKRTE
jgi:hypothetical protein